MEIEFFKLDFHWKIFALTFPPKQSWTLGLARQKNAQWKSSFRNSISIDNTNLQKCHLKWKSSFRNSISVWWNAVLYIYPLISIQDISLHNCHILMTSSALSFVHNRLKIIYLISSLMFFRLAKNLRCEIFGSLMSRVLSLKKIGLCISLWLTNCNG